MTVPTYPTPNFQSYTVRFDKLVNITERVDIQKLVAARAVVDGNIGMGNADAKAYGIDTLAQTLTLTEVNQGHSSAAFSQSVSSTNSPLWYLSIVG